MHQDATEERSPCFPVSTSHPLIDLVHLSRQTFGDPSLEREVLVLFADQARSIAAALSCAVDPQERARLCHLIKGSARGVGAFDVAFWAARGEAEPRDNAVLDGLSESIDATLAHVGVLTAD
ncbi:MAG: Hpt domain-containing protein [Devosiaceae bacterium]|nr:Hpt domain-containing protein [Devosiaceae bacterium MH13]